MKRLIVRYVTVFCVLFLTFPTQGAYGFLSGWDPNTSASRFVGLVVNFFYAGVALNGGCLWYTTTAAILTGCWYLGGLFLKRVDIETGSVLDPAKWRASGATKPLALAVLVIAGAICLWALLVVATLILSERHDLWLYNGPTKLLAHYGWLESAAWAGLMLFSTWPVGAWLARRFSK